MELRRDIDGRQKKIRFGVVVGWRMHSVPLERAKLAVDFERESDAQSSMANGVKEVTDE
jgi:hypothetical protein